MNIYAVINGINSLLSITIFLVIVLKRSRKPTQLTFAAWLFAISFWTFFYFLWGIETDQSRALFYLQMLMYPISFIHMIYFHFALAFSNNLERYKRALIYGYILNTILLLLNIKNYYVDLNNIRSIPPFHVWPHASPLLAVLIAVELYYAVFGLYILAKSLRNVDPVVKNRLMIFSMSSIIGWLGGFTNWFYWYDLIPIPPFGNVLVTFYILIVTYLIFKHDVLGLNIVIQKTFVYTFLTLFITLIFALFLIVSEHFFQVTIGYSSLPATLLAALFIALLFNPIQFALIKFVNKVFFGKSIEELSSENLQMKEELQKQDRLKAVATLAAGMAHEIKNPITAIKTFAEYLPEKYAEPEFRKKFQRIVTQEADRIKDIVTNLLLFSKPAEPKIQQSNVSRILKDILDLLSTDLVQNKIKTSHNLDGDNPIVLADPNQIKQAFLNIILNAIDAMKENGGELTIQTSQDGGKVSVSIKDTGCGIEKSKLPHIFDPFFTDKEHGTGLGLAVTHSIFSKHGAKVSVESAPCVGTSFTIIFPVSPKT